MSDEMAGQPCAGLCDECQEHCRIGKTSWSTINGLEQTLALIKMFLDRVMKSKIMQSLEPVDEATLATIGDDVEDWLLRLTDGQDEEDGK